MLKIAKFKIQLSSKDFRPKLPEWPKGRIFQIDTQEQWETAFYHRLYDCVSNCSDISQFLSVLTKAVVLAPGSFALNSSQCFVRSVGIAFFFSKLSLCLTH